ncbi:hypothetical protein EDB87DRAFT_1685916 [Lactarius vividus]|nr:hypothetical protein EDB87DRAFT_1685916 [Lactarius vividus]
MSLPPHGALTLDPAAAPAPGGIPIRRASHPSTIPTPSPRNHRRSHSQQSRPQSRPCLFTHASAIPMTAPPGVDGLSTTHIQAPLHVSTLPHPYHEHLQRQQQQQHLQQLVHGFDPHAQHVIAHAQIAPAPPLPSSHPKPRLLIPAQPQTNPQQTQQQTQQQNMTHTPTTASMLIPATVPVHQSSSTEQTLIQIRAQPPAPAPPTGPPFPLAMQMVSTTRMHEQVQTHTQQAAAVAGASVDATASASAGAGAGSAVQSTPGAQTRGPPRPLQMPHHSPVSARAQPTLPASSASNTPPAHQQQQQQHQRFAVPPALAAFKVLQPAKELLEQTWAAAIASVQQEFAAVHVELGRSAREKQALTELLQRLQGERVQAMRALHNTQTELKQCMGNFQSERRTRVHLERRLAEMTQLIEKCTCGAASAKRSPSTVTPPPLVVLDLAPPALPSSAPSPVPSSPASTALAAEARAAAPTRTPTPASGSSPRTTTQLSSSPSPDAARSSVRRHEREDDDAETVQGESAPKRRRIERTPTPTSSPSAPASEVVIDTREAPAPIDKVPTTQAPPQQQQSETPKTPAAAPRRKIGIQHIQLVYETVGSTLQCRMCLLRKREVDPTMHVTTFPVSAAYPDLVGHCEQEHDAALDALACMSPGEIAEMRQRFQAAQSPQ